MALVWTFWLPPSNLGLVQPYPFFMSHFNENHKPVLSLALVASTLNCFIGFNHIAQSPSAQINICFSFIDQVLPTSAVSVETLQTFITENLEEHPRFGGNAPIQCTVEMYWEQSNPNSDGMKDFPCCREIWGMQLLFPSSLQGISTAGCQNTGVSLDSRVMCI